MTGITALKKLWTAQTVETMGKRHGMTVQVLVRQTAAVGHRVNLRPNSVMSETSGGSGWKMTEVWNLCVHNWILNFSSIINSHKTSYSYCTKTKYSMMISKYHYATCLTLFMMIVSIYGTISGHQEFNYKKNAHANQTKGFYKVKIEILWPW